MLDSIRVRHCFLVGHVDLFLLFLGDLYPRCACILAAVVRLQTLNGLVLLVFDESQVLLYSLEHLGFRVKNRVSKHVDLSSMNSTKYFAPPSDGILVGPHTSVCTRCSSSVWCRRRHPSRSRVPIACVTVRARFSSHYNPNARRAYAHLLT